MLERFTRFGTENGFFEFKSLSQLDKSCCTNATTEVIDYDKTKEVLSKAMQINQPKSADALKIFPQLNRIDFIELKGFEKFIQYNSSSNNSDKNVTNQISKFRLSDKIKDSLFILYLLTKNREFRCSHKETEQYQRASKNYIIVVDIDLYQSPIKDRLMTLSFLSEDPSNIKAKIVSELTNAVNSIPMSDLDNLEKPKLLSCNTIDRYYESLNSQFNITVV
jgi:hypothetical protein